MKNTLTKRAAVAAPATPPPAPDPAVAECPRGIWAWASWVLILFVPAVGLVLGLLFARSSAPKARRFAWICLVLAFIRLALGAAVNGFEALNLAGLESGEKYFESYY